MGTTWSSLAATSMPLASYLCIHFLLLLCHKSWPCFSFCFFGHLLYFCGSSSWKLFCFSLPHFLLNMSPFHLRVLMLVTVNYRKLAKENNGNWRISLNNKVLKRVLLEPLYNKIWITTLRFSLPQSWHSFSSVQFSCSVVSDSLRPHESQHTRPACPSPTPGVHSGSRPSSPWYHPVISSWVIPFSSCPQSLPASESFPMSQLFAWGGQSTGVSALASFLPKNTQDWSPLELVY